MDELVRSGAVDLIVVDSVSALVPRSEVEGDIGTPQVTGRALPDRLCPGGGSLPWTMLSCGTDRGTALRVPPLSLLLCVTVLQQQARQLTLSAHMTANGLGRPLLPVLRACVCATQIGSQARLMSVALRKVASHANKCDCTIIFINQLRYKVSAHQAPRAPASLSKSGGSTWGRMSNTCPAKPLPMS